MAYDNSNSGLLARNSRKQQPNHPDYTGQCEVNGTEMWISAWIKDGKPGSRLEGQKYFSLSFKPKEAAPSQAAAPAEDDGMTTPVAVPPAPKPVQAKLPVDDSDVQF